MWVDNFSKTLARSSPNLRDGVWTPMLWTGVAFKMCDVADNFDFDYQYADDGAVIPGMPPTLFGNEDEVERLARWLCVGAGVVKFYADSIAVKYEVSSIPPKVAPQRILEPAVRARLAKSRDGLDRFHQSSIVDFNIGSNLGLMHIVKYILADEVLGAGGYLILNVDMNIYDRLIKVFVILVMFSIASCCLVVNIRQMWNWTRVRQSCTCLIGPLAQLQASMPTCLPQVCGLFLCPFVPRAVACRHILRKSQAGPDHDHLHFRAIVVPELAR